MKTLTAAMQHNRQLQTSVGQKLIPAMNASIREALAVLSAVVAASAVVMLSVWVAGLEISNILGASTWGLGFIFLGLAIDNSEPTAFLHLLTGVALLVLAWLQNTVSPDYNIVSGVLVALWVAVAVFRWLR